MHARFLFRIVSSAVYVHAAIQHVLKLLCMLYTFAFSYLANDGSLIIPGQMPTSAFFNLQSTVYRMLQKINFTTKVRYRKEKFVITHIMAIEYLTEVADCIFDTKFIAQPDGDYYKHLGVHYTIILL